MAIPNLSDDYSSPENEDQIQKWLSIVSVKDGEASLQLVPADYRKICVSIASFLPSFIQMYLCGLLSNSQYCELITAHQEYVTEQKAIADFCGRNTQYEDLVPTWKDLLPRLENPVFHSPIMDVYFGLTDKMNAVWEIADLDMLNILKQYIDLDDGHHIPQILG
ncbi:MAG: hypothetical protein ACI4QM_05075, partial [Alphaproteobacteria bacterium]